MPEICSFLAWSWDVDEAIGLIAKSAPARYSLSKATMEASLSMVYIDEDYAASISETRLKEPAIFIPVTIDGKSQSLCIDGRHRIWRWLRDGVPGIAVMLTEEEERECRESGCPRAPWDPPRHGRKKAKRKSHRQEQLTT